MGTVANLAGSGGLAGDEEDDVLTDVDGVVGVPLVVAAQQCAVDGPTSTSTAGCCSSAAPWSASITATSSSATPRAHIAAPGSPCRNAPSMPYTGNETAS